MEQGGTKDDGCVREKSSSSIYYHVATKRFSLISKLNGKSCHGVCYSPTTYGAIYNNFCFRQINNDNSRPINAKTNEATMICVLDLQTFGNPVWPSVGRHGPHLSHRLPSRVAEAGRTLHKYLPHKEQ